MLQQGAKINLQRPDDKASHPNELVKLNQEIIAVQDFIQEFVRSIEKENKDLQQAKQNVFNYTQAAKRQSSNKLQDASNSLSDE